MVVELSMAQYGLAFKSQLGFALDPCEVVEKNPDNVNRSFHNNSKMIVLRGQGDAYEKQSHEKGKSSGSARERAKAKSITATSRSKSPSKPKRPAWNDDSCASFAGPGKRSSDLFDAGLRKDAMRLGELKTKADVRSGRIKEKNDTRLKRQAWNDDVGAPSPVKGGRKAAGLFGAPPPLPPPVRRRPTAQYGVPKRYPVSKRYANVKRKRPLWEPKSHRQKPKPDPKDIAAASRVRYRGRSKESQSCAQGLKHQETSMSDTQDRIFAEENDEVIQMYRPPDSKSHGVTSRAVESPRQVDAQSSAYKPKVQRSQDDTAPPKSATAPRKIWRGDSSRLQQAVNQAVERETQSLLGRIESMVTSHVGTLQRSTEASRLREQNRALLVQEREKANLVLKGFDRLVSLETRIKNKWSYLDDDDDGDDDENKDSTTLSRRNRKDSLKSPTPVAELQAQFKPKPVPPRVPKSTKFPQTDEEATTSILTNCAEFRRHRQMVEATLQGTGMSQHQIVESLADVLYQKYLAQVSSDLLHSCDSIAEALFETV